MKPVCSKYIYHKFKSQIIIRIFIRVYEIDMLVCQGVHKKGLAVNKQGEIMIAKEAPPRRGGIRTSKISVPGLQSEYKQQKRSDRTAEILRAAATTFRQKGYHATTMKDIADALDIRPATLYHYAASKEQLLEEICHIAVNEYNTRLRGIRESELGATAKIRDGIHMHLHPDWFEYAGAFAFNRGSLPETVREGLNRLAKENLKIWESILNDGRAAGVFRKNLDCTVAATGIVAMCNGILGWLENKKEREIARVADELATLCLAGATA